MSSAGIRTEIPASDNELVRRAKARYPVFCRIWNGDDTAFRSTDEALKAASIILAWEQRGYRDPNQIKRLISQIDFGGSTPDWPLDTIVEQAIDAVDACYKKDRSTALDRLLHRVRHLSRSEQRRILRKRGFEWPSTKELQLQLKEALYDTMAEEEVVCLVAPTSSGKTQIVVTTSWLEQADLTGGEPVVLFVGTTDARDEAEERAKAAGLEVAVLEPRSICPVIDGDHDEDLWIEDMPASIWFDRVIEYHGNSTREAHDTAKRLIDGDLPCCSGDERCVLRTQWEDVPRDEEGNPTHDLVIATDAFAHVPALRREMNVISDEQPSYTFEFDNNNEEINQQRIQQTVAEFLREADAPITTWEEFVAIARSGRDNQLISEIEAALSYTPDDEWFYYGEAHTITPVLTRALWQALRRRPDLNGRVSATVEYESRHSTRSEEEDPDISRLSVVVTEENTVTSIRNTPDFSLCRSVTGLDAWPCAPLWERNVSLDIDVERVIDPEEQQLWRLFERGLSVVEVGEASRPLTKPDNFNEPHARVIIETLHDLYPETFSTAAAPNSIVDRIKSIMTEVGIDDPKTMHHGEQNSLNTFRSEVLGLLYGHIDPGDDYVLDHLAECGYTARPAYRAHDIPCTACGTLFGGDGCSYCRCETCTGRGCTGCHETGRRRAQGRGFVGPDADKAQALLASIRESNCAQLVGRWGRDREIDRSIVYACTTVLPDSLVDYRIDDVQWTFREKQRAIIAEMVERERATIPEITTAINDSDIEFKEGTTVHRNHVQNTLDELEAHGKLVKMENATSTGAHVYETVPTELIGKYGLIDLRVLHYPL